MSHSDYINLLEMAASYNQTPLNYMIEELGWTEDEARKALIEAKGKFCR